MLSFLFSVVMISLSGVMLPGPMFAVTIAKSNKSPFAGAQIALGHAIVEVPLAILIYLGFARFLQEGLIQILLNLAGASMLFWLGTKLLKTKAGVAEGGHDLPCNSLTAGIMTSLLNPSVYIWWVVIGSVLIMNSLKFGIIGFGLLVPVHWLCDLVWYSFVSFFVYRTHSLWGRKFQQGLLILSSLIFFGFGAWFLTSALRILIQGTV